MTAAPTLRDARELLAMFTDPNHETRRGRDAAIEASRVALVAAIASQDAAELSDAMHEARFHLGFFCQMCGVEIDEPAVGYCSRECAAADNYDGWIDSVEFLRC